MNKKKLKYLIYFLPIPIIIFSLFIGVSSNVSFHDFISIFSNQNHNISQSIILNIRLPRILLVFFTGGILAVSGSVLQAIFRNPLVDPYVLGLSSGAAFGASLGLAFTTIPVQISAFVFAIIAVALTYFMARKNNEISIVSLILAGVITNGIFTALLTIVQILSDPFKLQSIVHWTMGDFQTANWEKFSIAIVPIMIGFFVLFLFRWKLNVIALGDEEAVSSGLNLNKLKISILLATTLASSAAIAVSGIIGLYGLIVPHIIRIIFGVNNKTTLTLNLMFGGSFLVLIDDISRSLGGFEIPIGVFTMLIGAPFFIWLLKKSNVGWNQ